MLAPRAPAQLDSAHMSEATATRAIAFFDVDNTLMRGASLYHLGIGAWRRRMISGREILSFVWKQARFIAVGENGVHLATVRERALEVVVGHTRAEITVLSREIFDARLLRRLWPETVAVARAHLAAGREVWLVSATAQEVADVIAERLGLTGAVGTVLEAVEGVYTGRLADGVCHGDRKARAAGTRAVASGADLSHCWAYSDSRNDIPLLNLVGNPVVVNPDARLHRYAVARHWPVMRMKRGSIAAAARASKKR
ncbi:HAD-IB family hydrolase [Cryobacterium sp. TMT1-21]|nr:HAD-IB family hydrolase [Cryobacterium sp. TmT2-59]TFD16483.1 HAD-IB family hydrolase [Cryobacterium sp. TMT1-21]TFD16931.1 HAD-IB family hydrolase [Cryobacterium sp. TMT4-10]TFD23607.1 HAD-IB family hydrolase [Cryobacterium sp. TMT2-23]TFD37501.1 HAD-IB family hydrolase [Cryobacterium sp. TMT2-10]